MPAPAWLKKALTASIYLCSIPIAGLPPWLGGPSADWWAGSGMPFNDQADGLASAIGTRIAPRPGAFPWMIWSALPLG